MSFNQECRPHMDISHMPVIDLSLSSWYLLGHKCVYKLTYKLINTKAAKLLWECMFIVT